MTSILESINTKITDVYDDAKFNKADFLAVLQGVVGFSRSIAGQSPGDFIDTALSLAGSLSGKTCLKKLDEYRDSIKKWLTFGENYEPLEDSSQLDFDQLDVTSIPDIMQVSTLGSWLTSVLKGTRSPLASKMSLGLPRDTQFVTFPNA